MNDAKTIRIGTRASLLARTQTEVDDWPSRHQYWFDSVQPSRSIAPSSAASDRWLPCCTTKRRSWSSR